MVLGLEGTVAAEMGKFAMHDEDGMLWGLTATAMTAAQALYISYYVTTPGLSRQPASSTPTTTDIIHSICCILML
jgi:hypothetical protein